MGKRKGKPAIEPGTDAKDENGKSKGWSKLTPAEKGAEFDASHRNPGDYSERNFQQSKIEGSTRRFGSGPKHKKK